MDQKPTVVHVTHEAAGKIGGIGAVLEGMFTSHAYNDQVGRTILVCPLFRKAVYRLYFPFIDIGDLLPLAHCIALTASPGFGLYCC